MQDTTHDPEPAPPAPADELPACASCTRRRREGEEDYHPFQAFAGGTLGWYSGDDGEICGDCLGAMMRGQIP
jgi:hypothetical protein